jgi:outer membrane immunogenic protein
MVGLASPPIMGHDRDKWKAQLRGLLAVFRRRGWPTMDFGRVADFRPLCYRLLGVAGFAGCWGGGVALFLSLSFRRRRVVLRDSKGEMTMLKRVLMLAGALTLLGGVALAADLPTRKAPPDYVPAPQAATTWTGFYIGVNGGYAGDQFRYPFSGYDDRDGRTLISGQGDASLTSGGFVGGIQAGYNWQFDPSWLVGLEADIDATSITGKVNANASGLYLGNPVSGSLNLESQQQYLGTVRARFGYLVTQHFLLFGTGGLAYGDVKSSASLAASESGNAVLGPYDYSKTTTHFGWTLGAGVEYMINKNWSFKTEYMYVDLGTKDVANGAASGPSGYSYDVKVHPTDNIVRAGLNYRFD